MAKNKILDCALHSSNGGSSLLTRSGPKYLPTGAEVSFRAINHLTAVIASKGCATKYHQFRPGQFCLKKKKKFLFNHNSNVWLL